MPLLRRAPASRLDERLCLSCGYRGPDLQGWRGMAALRCPDCGEDLYSRPPRSYREMEGLTDESEPSAEVPPPVTLPPLSWPRRLLRRAASLARRVLGRSAV